MKQFLADKFPDLLLEWDYEKNQGVSPESISISDQQKVWWKCTKTAEHPSYLMSVYSRTRKKPGGCLYCSGKAVCEATSLATLFPEVASHWHPTLNGDLTPEDVLPKSTKVVYWTCPNNAQHPPFKAEIKVRTKNSKSSRAGCLYCLGRKVNDSNSLASTHPELAKEWHPTLNGDLRPNEVTKGMDKTIHWTCSNKHHPPYPMKIQTRVKGYGCPRCSGRKASEKRNLSISHPQLALEWHPTLNKELTPQDVTHGMNINVWWQCLKRPNHPPYKMRINNRTKKPSRCPTCAGRLVVFDEENGTSERIRERDY